MVVVIGAGVIGSSIAYHLTLLGATDVLLLEAERPACAASGKAGGFLARSWGDGTSSMSLTRKSFDMHQTLARELGISSYRQLPSYKMRDQAGSGDLDWVNAHHSLFDEQTAQVSPAELSAKLLGGAMARGATLRRAEVVGLQTVEDEQSEREGDRQISGVELIDGEILRAEQVVVAMGPWSCKLEDWLGVPLPMEGVRSTSLVYEGAAATACDGGHAALFCEEDVRGCSLEIFTRSDGDVYVSGCGFSESIGAETLRAGGLEPSVANRPDFSRVAAAEASVRELTKLDASVSGSSVQQACLRPCPPDGLPVMGAIPRVAGAYVAAGHNCWGITWAPVSGLAMAELVLQGAPSVMSLKPFSPRRFDTSTYRTLLRQRSTSRSSRGRKRGQQAIGEQW